VVAVLEVDKPEAAAANTELLDRVVLVEVLTGNRTPLLMAVQPPQVQQTQEVEVEVLEIEAIQ
jgi:hypothetical protein